MIQTMKTVRSGIGLHVDAHEFRAVQLAKAGDEVRVSAWAVFPRLANPEPRTDPEKVLPGHDELRWASSVLARRGFVGRDISLAVPARLCTQHVLELPPADSGAPVEMLARGEVARERRCEPQDFALGMWGLPARGRSSETMVVACANGVVSGMIESAQEVDMAVSGIDFTELAVLRASQDHLPETNADGEVPINTVLYVGWDTSVAVVTLGTRLVYVRRIAQGVSSVWELATGRYALSSDSARAVLGDYQLSDEGGKLGRIRSACWTPAIKGLASEVDVAIAYVSHIYRMAPLGRVVISGYSSEDESLRSQLDDIIGIPVEGGAPSRLREQGGVRCTAEMASRLTVAYGLAARFDS